jgi:carnitine-CoA ligase
VTTAETVAEVIRRGARTHGDRRFLTIDKGRSVTFAQYEDATARAAQVWRERGIRRGDRVVVALPNGWDFLLAWHGLNRLGAVMVPLNLQFRAREASYVLRHSEAGLVVTTPEHADSVVRPAVAEVEKPVDLLLSADLVAAVDAHETRGPDEKLDEESPASVLYTSGTTGAPKGCVTTHAHYSVSGATLADAIRLHPDATSMVMLPLFHMNALNSTMAALSAGAHVFLRDGFSASRFWQDVHRHRVTHSHYLGSLLPILDKREDPLERDNPLELLWGAGCSADAQPRLERRWRLRIVEVFGMTETGMDLCNPYEGPRKPGSCGVPVPGKELRLVDEAGNEVEVGEVGEITVRRVPGMTTGYLHDEAATAKLYREGWLHTGDLARRDADGYHYFVDRAKDVIRRSGENISSAEVEAALREHPDVLDVACVPRPDRLRDEEVHAVVTLRADREAGSVEPQQLRAWCEDRLARFKVPRYIEFVDELPRTPTGKIQKAALRDPARTGVVHDLQPDAGRRSDSSAARA